MSYFSERVRSYLWAGYRCLVFVMVGLVMVGMGGVVLAEPIKIAELQRTAKVDFQKEIFPFLKRNCLSCHNEQDADGDLVLESPQTIALGGESGDVVDVKSPEKSLLLRTSARLEKPYMPPKKNKVDAHPLSSEQLGLLKLWIAQGAGGSVEAKPEVKQKWRPIPTGIKAIYAVAISPDGQYVAAGRGNQIAIYHLPTNRLVQKVNDPEIVKAGYEGAHRDLVQSYPWMWDTIQDGIKGSFSGMMIRIMEI